MSHNHHPYGPPEAAPDMPTGAKVGIGCLGCFGATVTGFVALAVLGALVPGPDSGGGTTAPASPEASESREANEAQEALEADEDADEGADAEEDHPGLGDTVEHGDWEITVHAIEHDVPFADLSDFADDDHDGQWVTVEMEVTNLGSGPESFSGRDQVLMDDSGSMYRYDIWASDLFDRDLNPGTGSSGTLAYDVPSDFEADHMLVNGRSSGATGIRIELD
ncbi:DUF4352 domain-containing protein [Nocardiopsis oceani]